MAARRPLIWPFEDEPIDGGWEQGIAWCIYQGGLAWDPHVSGYAQIPPEGHPWCTLTDYDDLPVHVPGGLTFGPHREYGEPLLVSAQAITETAGWVGFDTGHAMDFWPREELARAGITIAECPVPEAADLIGEMRRMKEEGTYYGRCHRWSVAEVVREAKELARQIADARVIPTWLRLRRLAAEDGAR